MTPKHFLQLADFTSEEFAYLFERTRWIKERFKRYEIYQPLRDRTLAMVFEKASTRTRVSFEAGMNQLGGSVIMMNPTDTQLGRGETIADTARVLSRYVDIIMMRTTVEEKLLEMAKYATVPVINGLTDKTHPCQVMADLMTFEEHCGPIEGKTVAWTGDDNNVLASWAHAAERFKFQLNVATPPELAPKKAMRSSKSNCTAAWIHDVAMLLPSPDQATALPWMLPRCSS